MNQNPIQMMVQMANAGQNPMGLLQNMVGIDPQISQFLQMVNGKNNNQLQMIVENMCRERGTTIDEVARSIGLQIPNGR